MSLRKKKVNSLLGDKVLKYIEIIHVQPHPKLLNNQDIKSIYLSSVCLSFSLERQIKKLLNK